MIITAAVIISAFSFSPAEKEKKVSATNALTGEQLARIYCATCHIFPEPALLDKATWKERVLPNMGWRLGIRKAGDNPYENIEKDEVALVRALNIFPTKQLILPENWKKITEYYIQTAPPKPLPQKTPPSFDSSLKQFHAQSISFPEKQVPKTSMLKYDSAASLLYIGDAQNEVYILRSNLKLLASIKVESPPVDLCFNSGYPRVLCIGSISPSEKKQGSFYSLDSVGSEYSHFEKLGRPVSVEEADLNGDGKKDLIICQFGNHSGKLSWFDAGDPQKEHVLKLQPGSRRTETRDFDNDGKPDIMALFAQGREQLVLLFNKGEDEFEEKIVYEFPPVYGVSYFELADFNKDGNPDILITNGDNWDITPIRKNYHGIRILMNDGKNNFKVTKFIPFYGASKAVARDFDGDGDLDIAAVSFYDDPADPGQAFLYLENKGGLQFTSSSTAAAENGKWLTMEAADIDKDGDEDIILGSFVYSMGELTNLISKGIESFPQIVILWNDHKRK
ncbi:MAG: VCBS repeat-containing protein [Lacibacter sp.]